MSLREQKVSDIISTVPQYSSNINKLSPRVTAGLKFPPNAPPLEGIEKGNTADLWVEKYEDDGEFYVLIIARVSTDVRK